MSCSSNTPLVRRPGHFRRMAARSFVRIMQYEADVTVWPRCWNSVSSTPWQSQNTVNMTFPAEGVTLNFLCAGDEGCFHRMEAHRLGLIMVHPRLIISDDPRKHVVPFILVALEMLQ